MDIIKYFQFWSNQWEKVICIWWEFEGVPVSVSISWNFRLGFKLGVVRLTVSFYPNLFSRRVLLKVASGVSLHLVIYSFWAAERAMAWIQVKSEMQKAFLMNLLNTFCCCLLFNYMSNAVAVPLNAFGLRFF